MTALALLFYIAIWAISRGVLETVAAIRLRKEIDGDRRVKPHERLEHLATFPDFSLEHHLNAHEPIAQ